MLHSRRKVAQPNKQNNTVVLPEKIKIIYKKKMYDTVKTVKLFQMTSGK